MAEATTKLAPPYTSFKTFKSFIEALSETAVPSKVDRSVMPKMSGISKSQTITALKFLGLIDSTGITTNRMQKLVDSFGTERWSETLSEIVFDAYTDVLGDLDPDKGTASQLKAAFHQRGGLDGQLLVRAIRFWLNAIAETGCTVSPHFKAPPMPKATDNSKAKPQNNKGKGKPAVTRREKPGDDNEIDSKLSYMLQLPIGKDRIVYLPPDLNDADCDAIEASMPLLRTIAKVVKGGDA